MRMMYPNVSTARFTTLMNAINLLLQRQSNPLLTTPAPDKLSIEQIIAAGMRVPDHGGLQPWHFTLVSGDGLQKMSELFVFASNDIKEANLVKIAKMPFRAPLIIVVSTDYKEHDKVPEQEQLITAGCCVQAMQMAAVALGYGAIWRTGNLATNAKVKEGLGVTAINDIVGFLYVGSECKTQNIKKAKKTDGKVSFWV